MSEVVYKCNSTNNKNVRDNELEILRKFEDELYFEFGESEKNIKKRFYNDLKTLNQDFDALMKLKENKKEEFKDVKEEIVELEEKPEEKMEEKVEEKTEEVKNDINKMQETKKLVTIDKKGEATLVEKSKKKKSLF